MKQFLSFLVVVSLALVAVIASLVSTPTAPRVSTVGGTPTCAEMCEDARDDAILQAGAEYAHAVVKANATYNAAVLGIQKNMEDCLQMCTAIPSPCATKCKRTIEQQLQIAYTQFQQDINAAKLALADALDAIDDDYNACLASCP